MVKKLVNSISELQPEQFYIVTAFTSFVLLLDALWYTPSVIMSVGVKLGILILDIILTVLVFYLVNWLHTSVHISVAWIVAVFPLVYASMGRNIMGQHMVNEYTKLLLELRTIMKQ